MIYADMPHEQNCSGHNIFNPNNAINKTGIHSSSYIHVNEFIQNSPETQKSCMEADAIIFERNFFQDALTILQFYWVRAKPLIGIWDDGYSRLEKTNPAFPFWEHGEIKYKDEKGEEHTNIMNPKPLTQMKYYLHMLKGAQVVSDALIEDWSPYIDCYKINNHLVMDRYKNVNAPLWPHPNTEIWIGWTGSLSHRYSFQGSGLMMAYRKICKKFPNVKILITGDKKIYDELDIPNNRKMFCGFVPADQYPALIKSLDICTIPLAGEYDKRRSQIKPLECLALKVPFIATDYPNYNHLRPYGTFTENGKENWENAITDAIENLPMYREKAVDVGYPFALTQDIDLHVQERIDLYQKLIDKPYRY
jgi:glycosyltransferase involved in cell wall biosynthesis